MLKMTLCEMCGKSGNLVLAEVEGVELKVCPTCAKHGTIKSRGNYNPRFQRSFSSRREEVEEKVVENYAKLLRESREKNNLNQEDFAKLLNEKVSLTSKWESGSMPPSLEEAKKLQRVLGITLVKREEAEEELKPEKRKPGDDTLTLGDFIKVKKRN
jgi:putative transcription factor